MSIFGKAFLAVESIFVHPKCFTHEGVISNPIAPSTPPLVAPRTGPAIASTDNLTLESAPGNTADEAKRIPLIQTLINKYVQSQEFMDYMTNPANALDVNQINGLTPEQAVAFYRSSIAHAVVVFYYKRWTTVIGYRNPGENIIYCNRKYHDYYTIKEEASNLIHEFAHMIPLSGPLDGFQHDFNATARRPFSFNYRSNDFVDNKVKE